MQYAIPTIFPTFNKAVVKNAATKRVSESDVKQYIFNIDCITRQEMTYSMTHLHQEASRMRRKNVLPVRGFGMFDFVCGL